MKTPRVTDFDPNAKPSTLKSSLEDMPSIQKPSQATRNNSHQSPVTVTRLSKPRPMPKILTRRPSQHETTRSYVRRTFDFYDDQITYLTRRSLQEKLDGKEISMNEMVREAIDDWINKNNSAK